MQLRRCGDAHRVRGLAADWRARRDGAKPLDRGALMNLEDVISPEFRKNAKILGNEMAWCGTDIIAILKELVQSQIAVMGVESVIFPGPDSSPLVEAISDCSAELRQWQKTEPWVRCVDRTFERAIFDIERNVKAPYRDDIWYIVCEEPQLVWQPHAGQSG
jgi:hypothetical protein